MRAFEKALKIKEIKQGGETAIPDGMKSSLLGELAPVLKQGPIKFFAAMSLFSA